MLGSRYSALRNQFRLVQPRSSRFPEAIAPVQVVLILPCLQNQTVEQPDKAGPALESMDSARTLLIDEAARVMGVSRRTVYYRIRDGRLRTIRTRCGLQRIVVARRWMRSVRKVSGKRIENAVPPRSRRRSSPALLFRKIPPVPSSWTDRDANLGASGSRARLHGPPASCRRQAVSQKIRTRETKS